MGGFIVGENRFQATLLPDILDDYIAEENPVRVVDVFIDGLNFSDLDFKANPEATGRPGYHPATLPKLYVYGYLNSIQSSRRLERKAGRNLELMRMSTVGCGDGRTASFGKFKIIYNHNQWSRVKLILLTMQCVVTESVNACPLEK